MWTWTTGSINYILSQPCGGAVVSYLSSHCPLSGVNQLDLDWTLGGCESRINRISSEPDLLIWSCRCWHSTHTKRQVTFSDTAHTESVNTPHPPLLSYSAPHNLPTPSPFLLLLPILPSLVHSLLLSWIIFFFYIIFLLSFFFVLLLSLLPSLLPDLLYSFVLVFLLSFFYYFFFCPSCNVSFFPPLPLSFLLSSFLPFFLHYLILLPFLPSRFISLFTNGQQLFPFFVLSWLCTHWWLWPSDL